ncbi:hypothetical protein AM1_A0219 (plasmid) [Acaryochloris marina MBIC11017]|uniref:Uncharacterized protein n=1 Tax=Acaryochloris marina (strain MBIC 11017) TaxID=329726 RepID=A8ZKM2_ACAM1|nr:hypothetical protein AM1_A0219 [Acaryochloris marina MBIC11017]
MHIQNGSKSQFRLFGANLCLSLTGPIGTELYFEELEQQMLTDNLYK